MERDETMTPEQLAELRAEVQRTHSGLAPGDYVIRRGVDVWMWGVRYTDGTDGFITWGERREQKKPIGLEVSNGKTVRHAVRLVLMMQLTVRTAKGKRVLRLVPADLS